MSSHSISDMNEKVCQQVGVYKGILYCKLAFKEGDDGMLTAPCMADPHSAIYIKKELCGHFVPCA